MNAKRLGATLAGAFRCLNSSTKKSSQISEGTLAQFAAAKIVTTIRRFSSIRIWALVISIALTLLPAACLFAGDNPSLTGPGSGQVGSFAPGGVGGDSFSDMGNGEVVDNLTGNLIVTHPVGVPLNGISTLPLSIVRVYQSASAESKPYDIDDFHKYPFSWLGYRWTLTMGRISIHGSGLQTYYVYEGQGGDEHRLYRSIEENDPWWYTADGSYLRARHYTDVAAPDADYWTVFFPNGNQQDLKYCVQPERGAVNQRPNVIVNGDIAGWYATEIRDPYLNRITVLYYLHMDGESFDGGDSLPADGYTFPQSIYKIKVLPKGMETLHSRPWMQFSLEKHTLGGENFYLMGGAFSGATSSADHFDYASSAPDNYNYPWYSFYQGPVPVLVNCSKWVLATSYPLSWVAYDYSFKDQMAQNCQDPYPHEAPANCDDAQWHDRMGLRLSDIYYPTGLRSHYVYAQSLFIHGDLKDTNDMPLPPGHHNSDQLNSLSPDTDNWVYHSGVGVVERQTIMPKPDPQHPEQKFTIEQAFAPPDPITLKWTWNRHGIRDMVSAFVRGYAFVVTAGPSGREVVHYYDNFDYQLESDHYSYSSVAPFETKTAIFNTAFDVTNPNNDVDLYKKVTRDWAWADGANENEEAGDIKRAAYFPKGEQPAIVLLGFGNPRVSSIKAFTASGVAYSRMNSSGWDGFGHYERTEVSGSGLPCGTGCQGIQTSFSKFKLFVGTSSSDTQYCITRPLASGSFYSPSMETSDNCSVTGYSYIPTDSIAITGASACTKASYQTPPTFAKGLLVLDSGWTARAENSQDVLVESSIDPLSGEIVHVYSTGGDGICYTTDFEYSTNSVSQKKVVTTKVDSKIIQIRWFNPLTGTLDKIENEDGITTTMNYDQLGALQYSSAFDSLTLTHSSAYYYRENSLHFDENQTSACLPLPGIATTVSINGLFNRTVEHKGVNGLIIKRDNYLRYVRDNYIKDNATEIVVDGFGRPFLKRALMPDGSISDILTSYGPDGTVVYESLPYLESAASFSEKVIPCAYRDPMGTLKPQHGPDDNISVLSRGGPAAGSLFTSFKASSRANPFPAILAGDIWQIDPLGRKLAAYYPTTSTQAGDQEVKFMYSASGLAKSATVYNIAAVPDPIAESTTTYYLNALGRLIGVDAPEGSADALYSYNTNGKLRAARLISSLPGSTGFTPPCLDCSDPTPAFYDCYEENGIDCDKMADWGQVRTFTYDAAGHLLKSNDPTSPPLPTGGLEQGQQENLSFNGLGSVTESKDARALAGDYSLKYEYDSRGRLKKVLKSQDSGDSPISEYVYGDEGYISFSWDSPYYTHSDSQPSKGKLVIAVYHNAWDSPAEDIAVRLLYRYSAPFAKISDTALSINWANLHNQDGTINWLDFHDSPEVEHLRLHNLYDEDYASLVEQQMPDGQILKTSYARGVPASRAINEDAKAEDLIYTPSGALAGMNLRYLGKPVGAIAYSYDEAGRLTGIDLSPTVSPGYAPAWFRGPYLYDGAGNIASIASDLFAYDGAGKLVASQVERRYMEGLSSPYYHYFNYNYDKFGNLLKRTEVLAMGDAAQPTRDQLGASLGDLDSRSQINKEAYMDESTFNMTVALGPDGNGDEIETNRVASVNKGPLQSNGEPSPLDYTYLSDESGNVTDDGRKTLRYDVLGRQAASYDNIGGGGNALSERMIYDAFGARAAVLKYSGGACAEVTRYLQSAGEVLWMKNNTSSPSAPMAKKAYLRVGGKLVSTTDKTYLVCSGHACPPPTVLEMQWLTQGQNFCIPLLSEPSWDLVKGGSHADLTYSVSNLCDDIAWVELRKSRIKDGGKTPCNGSSCEDAVEVQRVDKPSEGWDAVSVTFIGLQGDKAYQVAFRFASTGAGHFTLGPLVLSAGIETLVCPKGPGSLRQRVRNGWGSLGPAWLFNTDAGQGYTIFGVRRDGNIVLGASQAGEEVEVAGTDPGLENLLKIEILSDAGESGSLPATTSIGPGPDPPGGGARLYYRATFYATDHLGTVRAEYPANAHFSFGSTVPDYSFLTLTATHDFEPFGVELYPTDTTTNTIKFTGQEEDACTGNLNLNSRFYQDSIGRFLKPDNIAGNIADPQSFNRYSYVGGNPVSFSDPTGHAATPPGQKYMGWIFAPHSFGYTPGSIFSGLGMGGEFAAMGAISNSVLSFMYGGMVSGPQGGGGTSPGLPTTSGTGTPGHWQDTWQGNEWGGTLTAVWEPGDSATPVDVGWEWLSGTGPRSHVFRNGDPFTEMLKKHSFIQDLVAGVSSGTLPSADTGLQYSLKGWQGVPKYFSDYSTLLTGGLTGNLAVTYLGTYNLDYATVDGTLYIHAWNESTAASAFRPPVIGYTDFWGAHIGGPLNSLFSSGPMSATRQDFYFTMPLIGP